VWLSSLLYKACVLFWTGKEVYLSVQVFYVPKTSDDSPSLIYWGRLVLADAWLFADIIQCCNVTNNVVPFFPFQVYFVGATILVLQQQVPQFLHVLRFTYAA
jgi:hypothetical protein